MILNYCIMKNIVLIFIFISKAFVYAQSCETNTLDPRVAASLQSILTDLPGDPNASVEEIRNVKIATPALPDDEVIRVKITSDSVPLYIFRPSTTGMRPIVVYFHPGGFVTPLLSFMKYECWRLAWMLDAIVFAVDYRVAPENRFPAAVNDAYNTFKWVLENAGYHGGDTSRIVLMGLSAGGNLTAVVSQRAKKEGLAGKIKLQVMNCPSLDNPNNAGNYPSYQRYSSGYFLTKAFCRYSINAYAPTVDSKNTEIAPVLESDLSGLPPALIITAEFDPLRDEAALYARRLQNAGVPVVHRCFPGQIHCLLGLPPDAQELKDADMLLTNAMNKYVTRLAAGSR